MTSKQILAQAEGLTGSYLSELPLWEIAYQLAVMNEQNAAGDRETVDALIGNPSGLAHDESSKRDAVPGDCQFSSVRNPNPWLELYFTAQQVLIHRRNEDFRRLRAAVDALSKSVPSPSPEPAGQDSSPTSTKEYWDYMKTRDLMKKTDREQNG